MPDFNGKAKTTCVHCNCETEFEVAAWNNGRYTTIAFTEKSVAEAKKAAAAAKRAGLPPPGEQPTTESRDAATDGEPDDNLKPGDVPY